MPEATTEAVTAAHAAPNVRAPADAYDHARAAHHDRTILECLLTANMYACPLACPNLKENGGTLQQLE